MNKESIENGNSVSILLGAGFSVPKGYPTAGELSQEIVDFHKRNIECMPDGTLTEVPRTKTIQNFLRSHQNTYTLCNRFIKRYMDDNDGHFDYEFFYDFITNDAEVSKPKYESLYEGLRVPECKHPEYMLDIMYNQMVAHCIEDRCGRAWYDKNRLYKNHTEEYAGFLHALSFFCQNGVVNVHTLNHDLLFESFGETEDLPIKISDGFSTENSPFWGYRNGQKIQLEGYTCNYDTSLRLYKLHGSLDYVRFHETTPEYRYKNHLKIQYGVHYAQLFMYEKDVLRPDSTNYHADFLTGKNKARKLKLPFYENLFCMFRNNLSRANKLIIIGYSGGDEHINEILRNNMDQTQTKVYIFDPKPSKTLIKLAQNLKARVIKKGVSEIRISDFEQQSKNNTMKKKYLKLAVLCLLVAILTIFCCSYASSDNRESYGQPSPKSNYTETVFGINMQMVYVKGGSFLMGCTSSERWRYCHGNDEPVHWETLDDYFIGKFEVTQAQWEKVMGTSIYQQIGKQVSRSGGVYVANGVGEKYPMYYVDWYEATAFCEELSRRTGKKYRLPTEAQWEYAARGGQKNEGTKYSGSSYVDAVAWYDENSDGISHPVGTKRDNILGIHDMSGNVWEWCADWYSEMFPSHTETHNQQDPSLEKHCALRGGSWDSDFDVCFVWFRSIRLLPGSRSQQLGFRVVCLP